MTTTLAVDHLTPIQKTLLLTLKGRAVDSRSARPILGDPMADQVMRGVDYDFDTMKLSMGIDLAIPIRTRMLDRLVEAFVAAHPDAVVVELGSGLETRIFRIDPPPTVDWYDVDFPEVIELRRRLVPERVNAHLVAGSVTEPDWPAEIPSDRPTMIVADGLVGFLAPDDAERLLVRLTDHFRTGELVFNAYTRLVVKLNGRLGVLKSLGLPNVIAGFGIDDGHEVERINPRLRFVEERFGDAAPEVAQLSWPMRAMAWVFAHWKAQARRSAWVVRYRF